MEVIDYMSMSAINVIAARVEYSFWGERDLPPSVSSERKEASCMGTKETTHNGVQFNMESVTTVLVVIHTGIAKKLT